MEPIKGFESSYAITRDGKVWSIRARKFVRPFACNGYMRFNLHLAGNVHRKYAHRLIAETFLGLQENDEVDHIDLNRMNNAIENLRVATHSENGANRRMKPTNRSGLKGVTFCSYSGRWKAQITKDRKPVNIGRFDTKEEAAEAYAETAKRIFGAFARI